MRYILMMAGTKAGVDGYKAWLPTDIQAHFAFLRDLNRELRERGELVANPRLGEPDRAKIVRAAKDSTPVTDGVFPEAKEFLLGYWIVDVASSERACEIAARLSGGPAPGGGKLSMPIEVREILSDAAEQVQ